MSDTAITTPKHIWIVGVLSLLWNSMGAMDYTMTRLKLIPLPPAQLAYIDQFPIWASIGWAFGVWGALAGSLLLLLRSQHAVTAFALSLAGLVLNLIWRFALSGVDEGVLFGANPYPLAGGILVVAVALFVYAQKQKANGVLR
ncbi:MAG: hypothetical protein ACKOPR_05895 [Chakrabartia godavariana]